MTGWTMLALAAPVNWRVFGCLLLFSLAATAAETPPAPDMTFIEFLGSVATDGSSEMELLIAIETELLPEFPEEVAHESK